MFDVPTLPAQAKQQQRVVWMVVFSMALHLGIVVFVPKWQTEARQSPPPIIVELEKPKEPPQKKVQPEPEPPKPAEPPKPKQPPKQELPKPTPVPIQQPVVQEALPVRAVEPPPPPPAVIAVEPQATVKPETVVAAPPPIKEPPQPTVSQEDLDAARGRYVGALQRAIAKHKSYPAMARTRGWQGEALVDIHLDGNGHVLGSEISSSSGYEILDKQALEMVKKASPFPAPPDVLQGRSFHLTVPVAFKLE